jgi:hypothetical protein
MKKISKSHYTYASTIISIISCYITLYLIKIEYNYFKINEQKFNKIIETKICKSHRLLFIFISVLIFNTSFRIILFIITFFSSFLLIAQLIFINLEHLKLGPF